MLLASPLSASPSTTAASSSHFGHVFFYKVADKYEIDAKPFQDRLKEDVLNVASLLRYKEKIKGRQIESIQCLTDGERPRENAIQFHRFLLEHSLGKGRLFKRADTSAPIVLANDAREANLIIVTSLMPELFKKVSLLAEKTKGYLGESEEDDDNHMERNDVDDNVAILLQEICQAGAMKSQRKRPQSRKKRLNVNA